MTSAKIRIFASAGFGVIIVTLAFIMNLSQENNPEPEVDNALAISTRKHIEVVDSDKDGVPDWQANLIDSEPIYLDATNTEPYVPPDTLTGQYSARFFRDSLSLDSFGALQENKGGLIEGTIRDMEEETKEKIYVRSDLENIVVVTNPDGLRTYGNLVAGNIFYYQTDEENEVVIFNKFLQEENPRYLEKLTVIEQQYDNIIGALLKLEVPEKYVFEHLSILNKFSALKENVVGMQLYFDDPFYTAMRYRRITTDVLNTNISIMSLYDALYLDEKIEFADDEALPVLVELLQ